MIPSLHSIVKFPRVFARTTPDNFALPLMHEIGVPTFAKHVAGNVLMISLLSWFVS